MSEDRPDSGGDTDRGDADRGGADRGGDPACWLGRVCPECGRFVEQEPPTVCPRCGATVAPE